MDAVAERGAPTEDQPLVSQPDQSALFMATRDNLRLVIESVRTVRDAEGVAVDKTAGKTVQFQDGVLRVPLNPKRTVNLTNGETIPAGKLLPWLEAHRLNGDWLEGFWRVDPTAPPASQQELETLQRLALDLDADGLREFIEQESAGWRREGLLDVARGTLERIEVREKEREQDVQRRVEQARREGAAQSKAK